VQANHISKVAGNQAHPSYDDGVFLSWFGNTFRVFDSARAEVVTVTVEKQKSSRPGGESARRL
jgi:hypothetical protein